MAAHQPPPPWDFPGKNTGVGCHFLLQCMKEKVKVKSFSHVWLFVTPWTAAHQAPPSMGFSRQECWSGVPLPSLLLHYSAFKLNKQGDNIRPWRTPFPIWDQSVVPCLVLTCSLTCIQVSQEAGQVVWYSHLLKNFPQFVVIHTVKGFSIVSEAEVVVFLEFSCFFYDTTDAGNLISGSSLCLFSIQLEHLEVYGSHIVEAWLGGFWALFC